jgi:hypothetical protein
VIKEQLGPMETKAAAVPSDNHESTTADGTTADILEAARELGEQAQRMRDIYSGVGTAVVDRPRRKCKRAA